VFILSFCIQSDLSHWKNRDVAVLGLGISNIPLVKFLKRHGANIVACDQKDADSLGERYLKLKELDVSFSLGRNYLSILKEQRFDYVFRSPGLRPDLNEIEIARNNGARITSEIELVFEMAPCDIIGITGSDGKTTTTTMTALMIEKSGMIVHIGGNIGKPLINEVETYLPEDKIVLELSSFQLIHMDRSPRYSLITNLSPNHLDYHKDYKEYVDSKFNIFLNQDHSDCIIINEDDTESKIILEKAKSNVLSFSMNKQVDFGAYLDNESLYLKDEKGLHLICHVNEVKLLGRHNIENILAAATLASSAGADINSIRYVAKTFAGVPHRLEFIREVEGVKYFNDSIASSPTRAIAALKSFDNNIVLIAGGSDKYISFDELGDYIVKKAKSLILLGQTSDKIRESVTKAMVKNNKQIEVIQTISLEEAVFAAKRVAKAGDNVLLSPACASFDMFNNFEQRGMMFKELVNNLK
jgi:UDP-N-acetylmuramoylalanine--D-glutamate ligase